VEGTVPSAGKPKSSGISTAINEIKADLRGPEFDIIRDGMEIVFARGGNRETTRIRDEPSDHGAGLNIGT
jgi:hypothetical protein